MLCTWVCVSIGKSISIWGFLVLVDWRAGGELFDGGSVSLQMFMQCVRFVDGKVGVSLACIPLLYVTASCFLNGRS
jgi:hypothetical protein